MYVLTINQRDTREAGDRVRELIEALAEVPALLHFQRSVGDEVIGVVDRAADAVNAALIAIRARRWNVGIGVGPLHMPLPTEVEFAQGRALVHARRAVSRAQRTGDRVPLAVGGDDAQVAEEAEAVLRLIAQIVATRTDAEWVVLDLLTPQVRGQQKLVAAELGITAQAVSKAVVRSHWMEEWACRPAAARLLSWVDPEERESVGI